MTGELSGRDRERAMSLIPYAPDQSREIILLVSCWPYL